MWLHKGQASSRHPSPFTFPKTFYSTEEKGGKNLHPPNKNPNPRPCLIGGRLKTEILKGWFKSTEVIGKVYIKQIEREGASWPRLPRFCPSNPTYPWQTNTVRVARPIHIIAVRREGAFGFLLSWVLSICQRVLLIWMAFGNWFVCH